MSGSDVATDLREQVRERYAAAARDREQPCCDSDCCGSSPETGATDINDSSTSLYGADDLASIPDGAGLASLGCGNPIAVAELNEGETVLDLGSGGGIDVLLSAGRVGPTGYVYGIDMTDEMLALARRHQQEAGAKNVEFRKGLIEELPLESASVDVIISNCVINLAADKAAVFAEMYRVLRPGGRIGVADIVADDDLSPAEKQKRGSWVGCIAGALGRTEYREGLIAAGFSDVTIEPTHPVAAGMDSAIIRARKG
jgi:arsenite methyltransferase